MNDRCFLDTLWSQMTTEQPMLAKTGFVPLVRTGQFGDGAISNMDDVEAWRKESQRNSEGGLLEDGREKLGQYGNKGTSEIVIPSTDRADSDQ